MRVLDRDMVGEILLPLEENISKRDAGSILLVAGGNNMAGAAILAANGALRSGAGLVRIRTHRENFSAINARLPEAICVDIDEKIDIEKFDAIGIGPGMGTGGLTKSELEGILREYKGSLVIDADGLNVVSGSSVLKSLIKGYPGNLVLTPHEGEAARLLGIEYNGSFMENEREAICKRLIEEFGCTIVLKGSNSLIGSPNGIIENKIGNPGMATGGSGDVLTGIVTAFLGKGIAAEEAARAGVYVHARGGDMAREKFGSYGMKAGDIADCVAFAIKEIIP